MGLKELLTSWVVNLMRLYLWILLMPFSIFGFLLEKELEMME
jgi:hypothetical protein